jgi:hypothetical protein
MSPTRMEEENQPKGFASRREHSTKKKVCEEEGKRRKLMLILVHNNEKLPSLEAPRSNLISREIKLGAHLATGEILKRR